jgi:hypothetical protein
MGKIIACIPADTENKLFIKDFRMDNDRAFVKYRSTYNDIPFVETQIYSVDGGQNVAITGDDGTILFRFSMNWINKIK